MQLCNSILIVEDNEDIRSAVSEILTHEGYPFDIAKDGLEALGKIRALEKPCLVLLDLIMPNMDGYKFIEQISQQGLKGSTHIVVMTALSTKKAPPGIRTVISKPFDINKLLLVIKNICGKPHQ